MSLMGYIERVFAIIGALASVAGLYLAWDHWRRLRRLRGGPTWDDALRIADRLLDTIDRKGFKPDLVIGLGRSGGIWGGWLAGNLGSIPFASIDIEYKDTEIGRSAQFPGADAVLSNVNERYPGKPRILIVEGAASTGTTFREFLRQFKPQIEGWDVKTAVLYKNAGADVPISFVGKDDLDPWPERFPWHKRAGYKPHLRYVLERTGNMAAST